MKRIGRRRMREVARTKFTEPTEEFEIGFTVELTGHMKVKAFNDWDACRRVEGMDFFILEPNVTGMQVEAETWEP